MPSHYATLDDILQGQQQIPAMPVETPVVPERAKLNVDPQPGYISSTGKYFPPQESIGFDLSPGYRRRGGRNKRRTAVQTGLDTLIDILQARGATDPRLLNRQLLAIQRGTESQQSQLEEALAVRGLGGAGVGAALQAALGASGEERVSDALAREAALQEERKRQDLDLILRLILGPRITRRGQEYALRAAKAGAGGSNLGAIGSILGGGAQLLKVLGVGGGAPVSNRREPTPGTGGTSEVPY